MSESLSTSNYLLTQVINYGTPLFALILFLGAVGLPVGGSFMVIAMGAFIQQEFFTWPDALIFGLLGAIAGDALSFGMGYYAKDWVQNKFGATPAWVGARRSFEQRGGLAVYLTRFLITALAIPTNLIAGGSGYSFRRFMLYDIAGELTWLAVYGGLGYAFGAQWEAVNEFISNFGGFVLGAVILGAGIWLARSSQNGAANQGR